MKVLVLGASGFIGLPTAQAYVRAGHIVYGLTRSEVKAKQLAAEEIIPIIGTTSDPSKWIALAATLDVIIEAVGGTDVKVLSEDLLNAAANAARQLRPPHAPKLTYVYTSGTWVHGDNRTDIVSDTTPLTSPAELVAWRPAQEQRVVTNSVLNGIVVRPALLYGRSGSLLTPLFKNASEGKVTWFGNPGDRYALIHCDDLADLFLRAGEKGQLVGGQIFDAGNDFTESADELLKKLVQVSGAPSPPEFVEPKTLYEKALTTTTLLRPYLARSLLGWQPHKAGLVDNLEVYYNAWKSSVSL